MPGGVGAGVSNDPGYPIWTIIIFGTKMQYFAFDSLLPVEYTRR